MVACAGTRASTGSGAGVGRRRGGQAAAPRAAPRRRLEVAATRPATRPPAASGAAAASPADGEPQPIVDVTWESKPPLPEVEPDVDPAVKEALERVKQAMTVAETSMKNVEKLPSARLPNAWDRASVALCPLAQAAALAGACAGLHAAGRSVAVVGSLVIALGVGAWGYRKTSLDASGAVAAAVVGWATLGASFRAGATLLTFFLASSKLTQLGEQFKDVDEDHRKGGQRDWKQVFCNALIPACLAVAASWLSGGADLPLSAAAGGGGQRGALLAALNGGFLGYYACCCGDTWSSELGQLSPEEPRLITSLRPVRKGTNGGVTLLGLAASLAGGLFVGAVFTAAGALAVPPQWRLLPLGLAAGLLGSLLDSLLGATIQFTGYNRVTGRITGRTGPDVTPISGWPLLDNNGVNAVSATVTAALAGAAAAALF